MALNPFFLQGSQGEQRLVQDIINEQLKIYGVEVTYIPRKFVNKRSIIEEVESSKFDDNFLIEAYLNTYEGYSGAGDVMTKFGVSLRDEVTLTISRERFEDFIAPFMDADDYELSTRPREGDLVYFPLGGRLFEVKFVEHEKPFYQLGKNYVYELQCELFEYEDEIIDTGIQAIDEEIEDVGFITTLNLVGSGQTATATASISASSGYLSGITVLNDGSGYTSTPTVAIGTNRVAGGANASAVAITTERAGVFSVKEIVIINPGSGYTFAPSIRIIGGGGSGAIATCGIVTVGQGVIGLNITDEGTGYTTTPSVTIAGPGIGTTATATAIINAGNTQLQSFRITNPGSGYTSTPSVTIGDPNIIIGRGNFLINDLVIGETSLTEARVKSWDVDTKILKVSNVGIGTTISGFIPGESIRSNTVFFNTTSTKSATVGVSTSIIGINTSSIVVGAAISAVDNVIGAGGTVLSIGAGTVTLSQRTVNSSSTTVNVSFGTTQFVTYNIREYDQRDIYDEYTENDEFEIEADSIIDFAETNPFGTY
tara:strand:+ start:34453 stop:36072 length:1620 start_codon:yes stop_codon:yes gene_type:complete